jgi:hypothetical protein
MGPSSVRCPACGHMVLTGMRPGQFSWWGTHSLVSYVLRSAISYLITAGFLAIALNGAPGASAGRLVGLIAGFTLLTFTLNGLWYRFRCRRSDRWAFGMTAGAEGSVLHVALAALLYVAASSAVDRAGNLREAVPKAGAPRTTKDADDWLPAKHPETGPSFLTGTWQTDHVDQLQFQVNGHKIVGGGFRYRSDGSRGVILRGYLTPKQAHYEWKDASRRGRATVVLRPDATLEQTSRWQGKTYRCRLVRQGP